MGMKLHLGLSVPLAFMAASMCGPLRADDNEIAWLGDYQEGVRLARQTNKPILVEFRCEA
jgi:hypothetical protein